VNSKQARLLRSIVADPVSATIRWSDIESFLVACGCQVYEGSGSRVTFVKDGVVAAFHRPHPDICAKRYQVRDAREYLLKIGMKP
jgi:HicA toxin of bacterial toxin-antitoxin,